MGEVTEHLPVKLVASILYKDPDILLRAIDRLVLLYGQLDEPSASLAFSHTDYYSKEMGAPLKRRLICFESLHPVESISSVKSDTNEIESFFQQKGKRQVNIDPGYLTHAKLVLMSTKDHVHRVYVKNGIYAECTLRFEHGDFLPWSWTYPDYATDEIRSYFKKVREKYTEDLKMSSSLSGT